SLMLSKSKSSEHMQVETLYLLIALKEMGREYRLDETVLQDYFNINPKDGPCNLNYFSISVLLFYIENKVRYNKLKDFLKTHIKKKFDEVRGKNRGKTTELTLLLFDLLTCPSIENKVRYNKLKDFLKTHIKKKFDEVRGKNRGKTTELTLLLFDLLTCPYI